MYASNNARHMAMKAKTPKTRPTIIPVLESFETAEVGADEAVSPGDVKVLLMKDPLMIEKPGFEAAVCELCPSFPFPLEPEVNIDGDVVTTEESPVPEVKVPLGFSVLGSSLGETELLCALLLLVVIAAVAEKEVVAVFIFWDELEAPAFSELVIEVDDGTEAWSSTATVKEELEAYILAGSSVAEIGSKLLMTSMIEDPASVGVKLKGMLVACSD